MQTSAGQQGPVTQQPPQEEKPCGGSQKGFASITITARRVGPPASTLVWEAVGDPLWIRCRAQDALFRDPSTLASGTHPCPHQAPFGCTEFSRNCSVMGLKVPEAHAGLCEGQDCWMTNEGNGGDSFSPGTPRSRVEKSPLVFSSCVHLRVSQPCPNSIYYLDRSLSVPIEPPRLAGPKTHRSVLSLNLNCSSHRRTPDGAGGTVNREPISAALTPKPTEGKQLLPGPCWNLGLQESFLEENPSLGRVHVGTGACPWRGSSPLENTAFAASGTNQIPGRKEKEDPTAHCHTDSHGPANQLSIHIPGWSYAAGE